MNLLTISDCFRLIRKMQMPDHIVDHSMMVSNVALCLGKELKKRFPGINLELLVSSALLHDITKPRSFQTGELHSETGASLLDDMGYPEIANIIRQHVILDDCMENDPVLEEEIVNYSDKRVLHDRVVSLDKRLAYIKERYGTSPVYRQRIRIMWDATRVLENKLFKHLVFRPRQLTERVKPGIKKPDGS